MRSTKEEEEASLCECAWSFSRLSGSSCAWSESFASCIARIHVDKLTRGSTLGPLWLMIFFHMTQLNKNYTIHLIWQWTAILCICLWRDRQAVQQPYQHHLLAAVLCVYVLWDFPFSKTLCACFHCDLIHLWEYIVCLKWESDVYECVSHTFVCFLCFLVHISFFSLHSDLNSNSSGSNEISNFNYLYIYICFPHIYLILF